MVYVKFAKNDFASYLTNRSQYTEINGKKSTYLNINTGVPQGSILCFADDTTAYKSGPNIKDLISDVNIRLQLLYTRLSCNKLSLNINKTSCTLTMKLLNHRKNRLRQGLQNCWVFTLITI